MVVTTLLMEKNAIDEHLSFVHDKRPFWIEFREDLRNILKSIKTLNASLSVSLR